MRYEIRAVLSMLAVVSLLPGCKQSSREEAEPAPATTPVATAPPSATAAETPPPAESIDIPPPVQPNVPAPAPAPAGAAAAKKAAPESIKTCCAALRKESETAAVDKSLYTTAAGSCDAIDKLVAAGTTKKSAALIQLRASLRGKKLPPGCE